MNVRAVLRTHTEKPMRRRSRAAAAAFLALLVVGCASSQRKQDLQREIDGLKLQVADIRREYQEVIAADQAKEAAVARAREPAALALAAATKAMETANQSLAAVRAAQAELDARNEKIDRMFKKSAEPPGGGQQNYTVVRVYYATDRNIVAASNLQYGTDRSPVSYGTCDVSVPNDHKLGEMESPKWWRFEFRQDPNKHIMVQSVQKQDPDAFFAQLKDKIEASGGKNAFVFVHGYNNSFEDAAMRTAQISYDLKFEGAPVFYSWPSRETLLGYPDDEANVDWATHDLETFLGDFVRQSNADNIYLIAHSMGTRALTRAFDDLAKSNPAVREKIREIILAAPDIDADVFKRDIAPALTGTAPHRTPVTLYASSQDRALNLSKKFHGYPRAGDSTNQTPPIDGIDTIDATAVDTGFLGHSYAFSTRSVLEDISALISTRQRACSRFAMNEIPSSAGAHCVLRP